MDLSPSDQSLLAQTVLGESGPNASDQEYAAIAHTVFNRMGLDNYPPSVSGVVRQPGQYQAWDSKSAANYAGRFGPKSPGWGRAVNAVNAAANGDLPDTTNGATHYLQPETVQKWVAQGKQQWPSWAQGDGQRIGQHAFYPEDGNGNPRMVGADDFFQRDISKSRKTDSEHDEADQFLRGDIERAKGAAQVAGPPAASTPNQRVAQTFEFGGQQGQRLPEGETEQRMANWSEARHEHPLASALMDMMIPGGAAAKGARLLPGAANATAGAIKSVLTNPHVQTGLAAAAGAAGVPEVAHLAGGPSSWWDYLIHGLSGGGH